MPLGLLQARAAHASPRKHVGTRYVLRRRAHAGRSRRPKRRAASPRAAGRDQGRSQKEPGKFEMPNWDPASQKKVRDALIVLGTTLPDSSTPSAAKDQGRSDPAPHRYRRELGRQSPTRTPSMPNFVAAEERRQHDLQAQRQGRAGRRLLVHQPLQCRRLFPEERAQRLFAQQHHREEGPRTARSPSSSAAATARFRTACRS